MSPARARAIEILIVEDNPGDVRLTKEALREGRFANTLHVVEDGEAAIEFLFQRGVYAESPRPDLVLLDLNLPKRDGREVLAVIKADPGLRAIPVVVLTSSKAEQDILRAYNLNVNCYVTKPVDLDQFMMVVQAIRQFWFSVVELPAEHDP
jgi:two-component system, chemotaxis family, response regulator Rcp1